MGFTKQYEEYSVVRQDASGNILQWYSGYNSWMSLEWAIEKCAKANEYYHHRHPDALDNYIIIRRFVRTSEPEPVTHAWKVTCTIGQIDGYNPNGDNPEYTKTETVILDDEEKAKARVERHLEQEIHDKLYDEFNRMRSHAISYKTEKLY